MSVIDKIAALFRREKRVPLTAKEQLTVTKLNALTMVNTIAISTDMETLYLIDNGRAIAFPLLELKGIIIGLLDGQLTVATAAQPPKPEVETELPNTDVGVVTRSSASSDGFRIVKLSIVKTAWSTVFDRKNAALCFIGATEVEIRASGEGELKYKPEVEFFELHKENIFVRRTRDSIVIATLPLKKDTGRDS